MNFLRKAEQVAERLFEQDSTCKVSIKIALAVLHDKMGHEKQAKDLMKEGLLMSQRIPLSIDKMGEKADVLEFINRYPETFSEELFTCK